MFTGAKLKGKNAAKAMAIFERRPVEYSSKFFKDNPDFWEHTHYAAGCMLNVGVTARMKKAAASMNVPMRELEQSIVTSADAIVRKAVAQLRFEIGMVSLGDHRIGLVQCHLSLAFGQVKASLQT